MDSFETARTKLYELYQNQNTNATNIAKKVNDVSAVPLDLPYFKKLVTLVDTGDVEVDPSVPSGVYSLDKGVKLPVLVSNAIDITVAIKEAFIPLVDWQLSFSSGKDNPFIPFVEYQRDDWDVDYFKVDGDGHKIWHGVNPPSVYPYRVNTGNNTHDSMTVEQARIDDGSVDEEMTLPAWKAELEWTAGGSQYRFNTCTLAGFYSNHYDVVSGDNWSYKFFYGSMWWDNGLQYPFGNFLSISGSSLTLKGYEVYQDYLGTNTVTANVTKTFNLSDLGLYVYGVRQKYTGGYWQNNPSGGGFGYADYYLIPGNGITVLTPTHARFLVYMDGNKRFLFAAHYDYSNTPARGVLGTVPVKTSTTDLPYAEIDFQVNPSPYPQRFSQRPGQYSGYKTAVFVTAQLQYGETNDPFWIRVSKTTDKVEKWACRCNSRALRMIESNTDSINQRLVQFLAYTPNGGNTGYNLTVESYSTTDRHTYYPTTEPILGRALATIRNPLYFKKTTKFDTTVG